MFSPVWVHIYSYFRNWELLKSSIFQLWMVVISVTCPLFCPTPAAAVRPPPTRPISIPPCLCSDECTSRIRVCALRRFSLDKILEMSRNRYRYMSKTECKWLNDKIICNDANVHSHQLGIRHWWSRILLLPAVIKAACSPVLANSRHHHWLPSLPTWKIKKDVALLFKCAYPWLLMK